MTAPGGDPVLCPHCEGDDTAQHNGFGEHCTPTFPWTGQSRDGLVHTPAPWEVEADDVEYGVYRVLNYGHDARDRRDFDLYVAQHEGNEQLIQRSPELLDELTECVNHLASLAARAKPTLVLFPADVAAIDARVQHASELITRTTRKAVRA